MLRLVCQPGAGPGAWCGASIPVDSICAGIHWAGVRSRVRCRHPAVWVWHWPTPELWAIALLFGTVGTLGHVCLTRALTAADATSVIPFDYLRLPFVAIIAYLLFGEIADLWVWLGGALIATGALYNARQESRAATG